MLYALPEGFPTPEARDGKGLAKALGDAAARWMRGEYAEALARMHSAVVIAATERATNARIDRLEKVVAQLDAWISARERGEDVPPPSLNESFVISVQVPDKPATERKAPATMSIDSRDMEIVDPSKVGSPPGVNSNSSPRGGAQSAIAHRPFSTTLEQASRPTPPPADPAPVQVDAPKRMPHGTTLPEGAFPATARADLEEVRRAWREKEAARSAGASLELKKTASARSDPFTGLDAARTPSAEPRVRPKNEPPLAEGAPVTVESTENGDEARPRSKISTQRFVPPTTRRPAEDEVYPPILPSEEDEDG